MEFDAYREEFLSLDKTRMIHHNAVPTYVNILNCLAKMDGLPPFYDGIVSENRSYLREVADTVLNYVEQVVQNRG